MKKTFDSVEAAPVMKAQRVQGGQVPYIWLLEDIFGDSTSTIILHMPSEKFPIRKGVRQGDKISLKLFTAGFKSVFRKVKWEKLGVRLILFTACFKSVLRKLKWEKLGARVNEEYLGHLRFADIILLINSLENLQEMTHCLHSESLVVGLSINMKKSKVMSNSLAAK